MPVQPTAFPEPPGIQYPTLTGKVPPELEQAQRITYDNLFWLRQRIQSFNLQLAGPGGVVELLESLTISSGSGTGSATILVGTHILRIASYPAPGQAIGTLYWETDRLLLYIVSNALGYNQWVYISGIMPATQATLPADLGAGDLGTLVLVTDYAHTLRWSGVAFQWSGSDISGYIAMWPSAPSPTTGWQLCDGSTVNRLNADGTLTSVTVPNYATAAYVKLATAASVGPNAAGGTTTSVSAGTPSGTNSAPVFSGGTDTTSADSGPGTVVAAGVGTTVATHTHTHTVIPTGTVTAPTFTGNALAGHDHGPGTLDLRNTQLLGYYRR